MARARPERHRRHIEHALLLIAREHGGAPDTAAQARMSLTAWRQADPAHEQAYQAARQAWLSTEAAALRDAVPLPASREAARQSRRRVVTGLGVAGLLLAMGSAARWAWHQPVYEVALATGHGQMRPVVPPDGSRLDLAALTSATITYYRDRREVWLARGEMRFEVRRDVQRPFVVTTERGRVQVLGTVFTVALRDGSMHISVAEGRVAVWAVPSGSADVPDIGSALEIGAGQTVRIDADGVGQPASIRPDQVGAWREGWLVFDDEPLPDVAARWNAYLPSPIRMASDPALRQLRLTGSYPLRNPEAFLGSLPSALPVRLERDGGPGVLIRMRP